MLLNLTNHPFARWTPEQREAAEEQWGTVQDEAFPHVDPDADTQQVEALARETFRRVLTLHPDAVLCQGEMTLTMGLVSLLQQADIPVYAATSQRCTTESRQGQTVVKSSLFRFCRFRAYPRFHMHP